MGTHTAQEQMGRPQEMSQERFQRGVDPADEGQEVRVLKMIMIMMMILQMRLRVNKCQFGLKILKHFDTEQSLNLKRFVSPSTSGGYEDDL